MSAQARHRPKTQEGLGGERRKGPLPAHHLDQIRYQMDGGEGDGEADTGLHGQHGADIARFR